MLLGDVAARLGVVTGFLGARIGAQQRLVAFEIGLCVGEIRGRGADIGVRGLSLGIGLTDVLRTRPGEEQPHLGVGLGTIGLGALQ